MQSIADLIGALIASPFICMGWLIVGAIAGALARQFMGSKDGGCLSNFLLGVIGAVIGGFIASAMGYNKPDGGLTLVCVNLILAVVGASVLIGIGRIFGGRSSR
jgi:uncharacterized membrane protein YeaQ/YmgE (transglycosylase-associated protein family)